MFSRERALIVDDRPNNLFELFGRLEEHGISKELYWKYARRFLESKSRRMRIPSHGHFELTPLCNFDCKMCYVHLSNQQFDRTNLLSVEEWKRIADASYKAGMRSAVLTGGECLTYPKFDDLYAYMISSGIRVSIMSNGFLVDTNRIELFKRYRPSLIQVSLYGSSESSYEHVTGIRAFNIVTRNISRMREEGLPVKLAITPSIHMQDDIEKLIHFADSLGIVYEVNPQLMQPRQNTGRKKEDLPVEDYMKVYRILRSIHHEELRAVNWEDVPEESHSETQCYGIRCGAGRSSFGIRHDGAMCPCLSLDEITAWPLEVGFENAWSQINEASATYPIPLECGDCIYQRNCLSCVAVHKSAPEPGHCDPTVCERMKRLVQEGFVPLKNIC